MAFVYVPNGVNQAHWWPKKDGQGLRAQPDAAAAGEGQGARSRSLGGLDQRQRQRRHGRAGRPRPGQRRPFSPASGSRRPPAPTSTPGVSVDQVAAQQIGHLTRFPRWSSPATACGSRATATPAIPAPTSSTCRGARPPCRCRPSPIPGSSSSGSSAPARRASARKNLELRREQQRSILDFVLDDARAPRAASSADRDQQKLDEYLTSVREIERRIQNGRAVQGRPRPRRATRRPASRPASANTSSSCST